MNWVVDTCVPVMAEEDESCWEFIRWFKSMPNETIEMNENLLKEYNRNGLERRNSPIYQWYSILCNNARMNWHLAHNEAEREFESVLLNRKPDTISRIDPSDMPVIVLWFGARDRHLVSTDIKEGDFSPALTEWLHREHQLCFHDINPNHPYHVARHGCLGEVAK